MIIQLPEWRDWRICGGDTAWEIQATHKKGKSAGEWYATNWFSALEHAIGFAYEKALRESPDTVDALREALVECEKTKSRLLKAVKKALADG